MRIGRKPPIVADVLLLPINGFLGVGMVLRRMEILYVGGEDGFMRIGKSNRSAMTTLQRHQRLLYLKKKSMHIYEWFSYRYLCGIILHAKTKRIPVD